MIHGKDRVPIGIETYSTNLLLDRLESAKSLNGGVHQMYDNSIAFFACSDMGKPIIFFHY